MATKGIAKANTCFKNVDAASCGVKTKRQGCLFYVCLLWICGVFFLSAALCASETAAEEAYRWPLDLPRELSSSFAEYRAGRFHAGIDLRTGGVTGKPVFAAADGYVSRVSCSPWGYGKAVYIQFTDGNSVVYAHLDDYYDVLREYVRQEQHKNNSYTVDLYLHAGQFPVTAGQQIAVSGSTGVGPPHLHYELRDGSGRPFNPRLADVQWPDGSRPVIQKLLVVPDGTAGTVNGGYAPVVLEVSRLGDGRYLAPPVAASGRIGIGVEVIDPGAGSIKMGVHTVRLLHEDSEVFQVRYDLISYGNIHNGAIAYHPFLLKQGRFLLLWRWPGNVSPSYSTSKSDGWFTVPDTPSELVVESVDFLGNRTELVIPIIMEAEKPIAQSTGSSGKVSMECYGEYLLFTVEFQSAEGKAPELIVEGGEDNTAMDFRRISERTWTAAFKPERSGCYTFRIAHPGIDSYTETVHALLRGDPEQTVNAGDTRLRVKPNSPYGVMFVKMTAAESSSKSSLRQVGNTWHIWPDATPVDAQVELTLPLPDAEAGNSKVRIYRRSGSGWSYVGGKRQGSALTAAIRSFGVYAVLEDTQPPTITEISPPEDYLAQTRRPIIHAVISDAGCGTDEYAVTANGQWLLASYDPDTNQLAWERDEDLPSGKQELVFRVTDSVGNIATVTRTIHIP